MSPTENGFSSRLGAACDKAGIKQGRGRVAELHRRWLRYTGKQVSLETIRRWLSGEAMPTMGHATELADMLGVSTEALLSSRWSGPADAPLRNRVPLLAGKQLSSPGEAMEKQEYAETIETTLPPKKSRFGVRQQGDSMRGVISDGADVILDYQIQPQHGDYVLAERDGAWMIRQLVIEGSDCLLRPAHVDTHPHRVQY